MYSVDSGAKFIVVGTPAGVSLSPEGGAHQSQITPSIGIEMADLDFYEPCFGHELEWILLAALDQIRVRGRSTYLRLTSKRVDQSLFKLPSDPAERDRLRQQVLNGAYMLVDRSGHPDYRPGENVVHLMSTGAMIPEAVAASNALLAGGVVTHGVSMPGPGPRYRSYQHWVTVSRSA